MEKRRDDVEGGAHKDEDAEGRSRNEEKKSYMGAYTRFLFFSGLWTKRPEGDKLTPLFYFVAPAYAFFFVISLAELQHNWGDINLMTETVDMTMIFTVTGHKCINVMWREKEWKRLIRIVENNFNRPKRRIKPEDRPIMEESVRSNFYWGIAWSLLVITMLGSFTVRPLMESLISRGSSSSRGSADLNITLEETSAPSLWNIPYRTWTPFDHMSGIPYGVVYGLHVFVASLQIFLVPSFDMFTMSLINYTCGQFRILRRELTNIRENAKTEVEQHGQDFSRLILPGALEEEDTEASPRLDSEMRDAVRDFVEHHETLLKFSQDIEELLNTVFLSQFMSSSFIICTSAFQLADRRGGFMKLSSFTELLLAAMFQLGMFCYFSDLLMQESLRVGYAVYSCEWYHSSLPFRRSASIIMSRALRPCYITFGRFAELSMETYAGIVRISFTYYTVLNGLRE